MRLDDPTAFSLNLDMWSENFLCLLSVFKTLPICAAKLSMALQLVCYYFFFGGGRRKMRRNDRDLPSEHYIELC